MEIPEINMITDFQASLISRFLSLEIHRFWKYGAFFFAVCATFSSIVRKIKLLLLRFHAHSCSIQNQPVSDDDEISSASSDDDADGPRPTTSFDRLRVDRDFKSSTLFRTRGSTGRRSCGGALSDFASGKSVVRLWEGLGLSLDFDEDLFGCGARSVVSTWDGDEFGDFPATVVLTARGDGNGDGVVFGGYDTRMRRRVPVLYGEWSAAEKVAGVGVGGVGKVCVRDDVNGRLTVVDVRNVWRPLESGREADGGETWWDADAVIVD